MTDGRKMETNVEHVVVYQGADKQWRWHAVARNGEIVAQGESHTREIDAARAIQGVFGDSVTIVRVSDVKVAPPEDTPVLGGSDGTA